MALDAGCSVRSVDNPGREGVVTNLPPRHRASGNYYQVRWNDGGLDFVHEDEIEPVANLDSLDPFALAHEGRYGRAGDLRRNLTYVHLSGRLANLVYAMGITNTDFYPHQYRPLLALLDSPINGLLIADEVGLGKTIEAGLIWTELRARFDMRRLVIVCPAMLREKWRDELRNRFGVDSMLVDAEGLLDSFKTPNQTLGEGRAWIISYNAARPPKVWEPGAKPARERPGARWELAEFLYQNSEEMPVVDLVVFDEAHYMRNSETTTWKLGNLLREVSAYQLMLSATPINLRNRDLFNLLNLLDSDHFSNSYDFERLIDANRPLVAARDAVLNLASQAKDVIAHLQEAARHPALTHSLQLREVLAQLPTENELADKRYRAQLADLLERISLISHVVTRTRKRDVQERRIRRDVRIEPVPMTAMEQRVYELVTETTRQFAMERGINDGFLLATPQRQVTSCPAAIVQAWSRGWATTQELLEDSQIEDTDDFEEESEAGPLTTVLMATVPGQVDIEELERNDSKFTRLMEVAGHFLAENPLEKIVIFTTFRATARYLERRLTAYGLPTILIWGNQEETKQTVIDRFRKSTSLRVLVSTEVAAEGVDLQFCRVLVNYDLPWNPTRIEQRIGRIDRLGQKAEIIHIWNLYFDDTIDARVVERLLKRLRIFEEALGEAEAIVGQEVRKLESSLFNRLLSREEEEFQIDQAAQALENLRIRREELEQNAPTMMAHGQHIIERIEAAQELARRVTEDDLHVYVRDYLNRFWPGHRFLQEGADRNSVSVQLPPELAAKLGDFLRQEGSVGKTALDQGRPVNLRFLNRISEEYRVGEIVHQFHPLIRFITSDLRSRNEHFYPLVAVKVDHDPAIAELRAGQYAFYVRSWLFEGIRDEEILATCVVALETGEELDEDLGERLLQRARLAGEDWLGSQNTVDPSLIVRRFEEAEESLERRYRKVLQRKKNENGDRARFQLDSVDRYLSRRLQTLNEVFNRHVRFGRPGLAAATKGQMDHLKARMEIKRQRILDQQKVVPNKNFVCAGVIQLQ